MGGGSRGLAGEGAPSCLEPLPRWFEFLALPFRRAVVRSWMVLGEVFSDTPGAGRGGCPLWMTGERRLTAFLGS